MRAKNAIDPDMIILGNLAALWRVGYVEREVGGNPLLAAPTRAKYISNLENYILPRWKDCASPISGRRKQPVLR
jgi:hypothetical protein